MTDLLQFMDRTSLADIFSSWSQAIDELPHVLWPLNIFDAIKESLKMFREKTNRNQVEQNDLRDRILNTSSHTSKLLLKILSSISTAYM